MHNGSGTQPSLDQVNTHPSSDQHTPSVDQHTPSIDQHTPSVDQHTPNCFNADPCCTCNTDASDTVDVHPPQEQHPTSTTTEIVDGAATTTATATTTTTATTTSTAGGDGERDVVGETGGGTENAFGEEVAALCQVPEVGRWSLRSYTVRGERESEIYTYIYRESGREREREYSYI